MTKKQYVVSCPFCGCKIINERTTGVVYLRVTEWIVEEDGDYIYPSNHAPGVWQEDEELEGLSPGYECNDCLNMFSVPHIEHVESIMKRSNSND